MSSRFLPLRQNLSKDAAIDFAKLAKAQYFHHHSAIGGTLRDPSEAPLDWIVMLDALGSEAGGSSQHPLPPLILEGETVTSNAGMAVNVAMLRCCLLRFGSEMTPIFI